MEYLIEDLSVRINNIVSNDIPIADVFPYLVSQTILATILPGINMILKDDTALNAIREYFDTEIQALTLYAGQYIGQLYAQQLQDTYSGYVINPLHLLEANS